MRLSKLLKGLNILNEYDDTDILDVTDKTGNILDGCAFVCIKGAHFDGHTYAQKALEDGAKVVIVSQDLGIKYQVVVENTREAYAVMCKNFFDSAVDKLTIVGITGTNGKTSTAFIMKDILKSLGVESGLIGTVKNMIGEKEYHTEFTTPDPYDLHKLFKMMADDGIKYCIMETSSQAFHQKRLAGIRFKTGVFTNLSQDHLDYHGTIEEYKACKKILFCNSDSIVMNADDKESEYMTEGISTPVKYYGVKNNADLKATDVELYSDRVEYTLNGENVIFYIPGDFSVYNSLAAIGAVCSLGFDLQSVITAASKAQSVKGRVELLKTNTDYSVIIDYAHTPDGLEKAITAVRGFTKGRVITLFGCGGDRDKTKRPKMGRMATDLSDIVIITTDNPRTEDPEEIIKDILIGTVGSKAEVVTITDRTDAIYYALGIAEKGDTVLLAGKGHETYQVIGETRYHYDEREVVKEFLGK